MRKISFDEVKRAFESRGYELLEDTYLNNSSKMRYKCSKHPNLIREISYKELKKGRGCLHCSGKAKMTISEAKELFSERGYELLETEFLTRKTRMRFICPKHPDKETTMTIDSLTAGSECYYCGVETARDKRKVSFGTIKEDFEKRGYTLLVSEGEYINNKQQLNYVCREHPDKKLSITYNNLMKGAGCLYCAGRRELTIEEVKSEFAEKGLILLEEVYTDNRTKMRYKCVNHPDVVQSVKYNSIQNGAGCPLCAIERNSGPNSYRWKGGVSSLNQYLRQKLYEWKYEQVREIGLICDVTGYKGKNIHIHHLKPFHLIRDDALASLKLDIRGNVGDYTTEELEAILDKVKEYHSDVRGVPLEKTVHELFHNIYGFVTYEEEYYEFKERYIKGEFNDRLERASSN